MFFKVNNKVNKYPNENIFSNKMENMNSNPMIKNEHLSEDMIIKIQTFENITPITIKRNASVQDLKDKIFDSFNVPVPKQRLIFQGKLLQNLERLKNYKISDESVIHLVAKSVEENVGPNNSNQNVTTSSTENQETRINIEDIIPNLIEMPILRSSRRQRRRRAPHFDISDCFESMHQNFNTIQNLLNCKVKYDESSVAQSRTITAYDFSKSKYEVGQWVDVKDTIDQWLEAQVIAVRNNQAFIHYNGWGTRWDEWIDFSSPRIAPFKTYTMQSPTSTFLSPYPHVACDANLESQPRSIDGFYYLEKTFNFMSELGKNVDYISRLRKKNINQGRSLVRRDDFENESRDKESQTLLRNVNQISLNHIDYEILFHFTQIAPLLDRCGRLLSDVSLQISHLLLNPSLYPQLLLGYNNQEVSETMSCTSGYSIFTNEGSSISGFNQMHFLSDQTSIVNNLQRGIITSNQMVNTYSNNTNSISQINTNTNLQINERNQISNTNNTQTSNIVNVTNETNVGTRQSTFNTDSLPKINIQVSSILSPGEVVMYNGFNNLLEPNIDIYVHTLVSNPISHQNNNSNSIINQNSAQQITQTNNSTLPISVTNTNTLTNSSSIQTLANNPTPLSNFNNQIFSDNDLVENRREGSHNNSLTNSLNNQRENINPQNANGYGLLENLMTMIGQRRRGSVNSDTSNTSSRLGRENLNAQNTQINRNRVNNRSNSQTNQINTGLTTSLYRETGTQTDIPLNLLLNKDNNYSDNMMEIISNKSNRSVTGMSLKNRGAISYKSVSEISEFEEIDQEEHSEFVIRTNIKEGENQSIHSVNSQASKDIFEEKDTDESQKVKNINPSKDESNDNEINNFK